MKVVIGSGPTGLASALAVMDAGHEVLLCDAGIDIPALTQVKVKSLKKEIEDSGVTSSMYSDLLLNQKFDKRLKSHPGSKLYFNSSYAYVDREQIEEEWAHYGVNPLYSNAKGGLSNVWGSIVFRFPFILDDEWRFNYAAIESRIPISGSVDDLSEIYSTPKKLLPSPNLDHYLYHRFIKKYRKNLTWFKENKIYCGDTRVAIETKLSDTDVGCQKCGLCTQGCPWNHIWSSRLAIEELESMKGFHYVKSKVSKVDKVNSKIILQDGSEISYSSLYIACGPIATSRLLLKSNLVEGDLVLEDTQLSIIPFFTFKLQSKKSSGFTLSKFIIAMPSENYNLSLFCQLAGYSFDFSLRAKATLPFLRFIPNSILDFLFRFIGVAMVFQESSSSGQLIIKKINEDLMIHADASRRLTISEHNKYKSLIKSLKKIGVLPLKLFIRSVGIGESYHLGNLKKHNGEKIFEVSGKVCGTLNIYVVDSSSLPYLAPGPITLTAMANSYRITKDSI